MKVAAFFVGIFFLFSSNFSLVIEDQNDSLAKFTCEIADKALRLQPYTQDILIANNIVYMESNLLNNIGKCISNNNPIVLHNLRFPLIEMALRKSSLIIFVSDILSTVSMSVIET